MNTVRTPSTLSASEHAALFDTARERALQARSEAIAAFWAALGNAVAVRWRRLRGAGAGSRPARRRLAL
jgi:hypothetical protein